MISFRVRPQDGIEWDSVQIDGENEELLSHLFALFLEQGDWEFITEED